MDSIATADRTLRAGVAKAGTAVDTVAAAALIVRARATAETVGRSAADVRGASVAIAHPLVIGLPLAAVGVVMIALEAATVGRRSETKGRPHLQLRLRMNSRKSIRPWRSQIGRAHV